MIISYLISNDSQNLFFSNFGLIIKLILKKCYLYNIENIIKSILIIQSIYKDLHVNIFKKYPNYDDN